MPDTGFRILDILGRVTVPTVTPSALRPARCPALQCWNVESFFYPESSIQRPVSLRFK